MPPAEKARGDGTHRGTTLFIRKKYKKAVPQGTNSAVPPSLNLYQIISRPCNVGQPVRNYFVHSGCSGRNFPRLCISAYTDRRFSELPIPEVLFPSLLLLDYVYFNSQGISLSSPLSAEDRTKGRNPRNSVSGHSGYLSSFAEIPGSFTDSTEYKAHEPFLLYFLS